MSQFVFGRQLKPGDHVVVADRVLEGLKPPPEAVGQVQGSPERPWIALGRERFVIRSQGRYLRVSDPKAFKKAWGSLPEVQQRLLLQQLRRQAERNSRLSADVPPAVNCRCGRPIEADRLAVHPWTEQCAACAAAADESRDRGREEEIMQWDRDGLEFLVTRIERVDEGFRARVEPLGPEPILVNRGQGYRPEPVPAFWVRVWEEDGRYVAAPESFWASQRGTAGPRPMVANDERAFPIGEAPEYLPVVTKKVAAAAGSAVLAAMGEAEALRRLQEEARQTAKPSCLECLFHRQTYTGADDGRGLEVDTGRRIDFDAQPVSALRDRQDLPRHGCWALRRWILYAAQQEAEDLGLKGDAVSALVAKAAKAPACGGVYYVPSSRLAANALALTVSPWVGLDPSSGWVESRLGEIRVIAQAQPGAAEALVALTKAENLPEPPAPKAPEPPLVLADLPASRAVNREPVHPAWTVAGVLKPGDIVLLPHLYVLAEREGWQVPQVSLAIVEAQLPQRPGDEAPTVLLRSLLDGNVQVDATDSLLVQTARRLREDRIRIPADWWVIRVVRSGVEAGLADDAMSHADTLDLLRLREDGEAEDEAEAEVPAAALADEYPDEIDPDADEAGEGEAVPVADAEGEGFGPLAGLDEEGLAWLARLLSPDQKVRQQAVAPMIHRLRWIGRGQRRALAQRPKAQEGGRKPVVLELAEATVEPVGRTVVVGSSFQVTVEWVIWYEACRLFGGYWRPGRREVTFGGHGQEWLAMDQATQGGRQSVVVYAWAWTIRLVYTPGQAELVAFVHDGSGESVRYRVRRLADGTVIVIRPDGSNGPKGRGFHPPAEPEPWLDEEDLAALQGGGPQGVGHQASQTAGGTQPPASAPAKAQEAKAQESESQKAEAAQAPAPEPAPPAPTSAPEPVPSEGAAAEGPVGTVVNIRHKAAYDVYIGRPRGGKSPADCAVGEEGWLGNPFRAGAVCSRCGRYHSTEEDTLDCFRAYLWARMQDKAWARALYEAVKGKRLGCFCAPKPCHGDVLLKAVAWMEQTGYLNETPPAPPEPPKAQGSGSTATAQEADQAAGTNTPGGLIEIEAYLPEALEALAAEDVVIGVLPVVPTADGGAAFEPSPWADQLRALMPELEGTVSEAVRARGLMVQGVRTKADQVFMVLPIQGSEEPKASLRTLTGSIKQLGALMQRASSGIFVMPRPGYWGGQLPWAEVKAALVKHVRGQLVVAHREERWDGGQPGAGGDVNTSAPKAAPSGEPKAAQKALPSGQTAPKRGRAVAVTGHRPDRDQRPHWFDDQDAEVLAIKRWLREQVQRLVAQGYDTFLSGMAVGVDLWFAEAVVNTPGAKLVACLPFASQAATWASDRKRAYAQLLWRAHLIWLVDEKRQASYQEIELAMQGQETLTYEEARRRLLARNDFLVERAEVLLAVWDGSQGGTGYTVRQARRAGKTVIVCRPQDLTR